MRKLYHTTIIVIYENNLSIYIYYIIIYSIFNFPHKKNLPICGLLEWTWFTVIILKLKLKSIKNILL